MGAEADLQSIRSGGKPALARTLASIETTGGLARHADLLDHCLATGAAQVIGITGPPGVGKSTLTDILIRHYRAAGETVGVIAVDPSSRVTGGALLGDRTRLRTDPDDAGVFVRSMAARDRLGGLSDAATGAAALMGAVYNRVLVESVGIGQSEADVASVADTVVLCIQPGSGDSLQFMKAGVMEIPDIVAVTKSDIGAAARRAVADVEGALSLSQRADGDREGWEAPVLAISATTGEGCDDLFAMIDAHRAYGSSTAARTWRRRTMVAASIREEYGAAGLARADIDTAMGQAPGPFTAMRAISKTLRRLLDNTR